MNGGSSSDNANGGMFDASGAVSGAGGVGYTLGNSAPTSPRGGPVPSDHVSIGSNNSAPFKQINGTFLQHYANDILYNNNSDLSGVVGGGAGHQFEINSSDFPSLGGAIGAGTGGGGGFNLNPTTHQQQNNAGVVATAAVPTDSNRQQQQLQHSVQQQQFQLQQNKSNLYRLAMSGRNNANFNMTTEDFPALPGAPPPSLTDNGGGNNNGISSIIPPLYAPSDSNNNNNNNNHTNNSPAGGVMNVGNTLGLGGIGASTISSRQLNGTVMASSHQQQHNNAGLSNSSTNNGGSSDGNNISSSSAGSASLANNNNNPNPSGSGAGPPPSALTGDYGLLGLLAVIRMSDADRNALALGNDLTALGLNLNTTGNLYSTFASPWSENPTSREPHYQLPMCYYMNPPALKTGHLSKFQLETLFYIFYALPKDVLQAYAAQELYTRKWKYHADLKRWFKQAESSDGVPQNGNNGNPQYFFFDINSWDRRPVPMNSNTSQITNGLLTEEDVRVKFSNQ